MAVVSGILNVINAALGWRAQDVDNCLNVILTQLGGGSWLDGWPWVQPGNLDSANFASGMLLPIGYRRLRRHPISISLTNTYDVASPYRRIMHLVTRPMVVTSASIGSYGASTAGTLTGSLGILVNGATVATVSPGTQDLPTATTSTVPFVKYSSCFFGVKTGDVIEVDFSGLSGVTLVNMQLVLLGSADLSE